MRMNMIAAIAAAAAALLVATPAAAQRNQRDTAPSQPSQPSPLAMQAIQGSDQPDVLLDIPNLSVEEITLEVNNLQVHTPSTRVWPICCA